MSLPWREENDTYVITAYFKDPSLICSKKHSPARYIGDRLLIQNTSKSAGLVQIPLLEEGLLKTVWTEGECFWSMGKLLRCMLVLRSQFTALIYRQMTQQKVTLHKSHLCLCLQGNYTGMTC